MSELQIDTAQLTQFSRNFNGYKHIIPASAANGALRKAAKPMLNAARIMAPVGKPGKGTGPYKRGGATRAGLRIKSVAGKKEEIGRVLVGVSKKRDAVGWRTHFITRGTAARKNRKGKNLGRMPKNDFLGRAHSQKIGESTQIFEREIVPTIQKWIVKNIPPSIR